MPELNIRLMERADIPTCAEFMAATPLWIRYGVTVASATARLEAALASGAALFVAEIGQEVVGFVWCVEQGAFARSGYIPLIGVRPGKSGHGVGTALLTYAEKFLSRSSPDVFLTVSDFNLGAQHFYQKHGYVQVGALPDYVLDGVTELIYWKRSPLRRPQAGVKDIAQAISQQVESQDT